MNTKEDLLEELCISQYKTLRFLNKVMYETTKHQRSLPREKQNLELLDLAWSSNDIIVDHPREREIVQQLADEYGFDLKEK
ncbi:hypothetical protein [Bacillus sp. T33-2]|uniref:hypothetical protein n=1 Tax=Bacillus sp. T33-2 TaxID=2054168 RepID=UPI000C76E3A2|nr:hypothetical protein [Bacillus sp. T33-2]PLR99565.1 hypothetical protein CVD19_00445 [Bacillus sp. T33-2]